MHVKHEVKLQNIWHLLQFMLSITVLDGKCITDIIKSIYNIGNFCVGVIIHVHIFDNLKIKPYVNCYMRSFISKKLTPMWTVWTTFLWNIPLSKITTFTVYLMVYTYISYLSASINESLLQLSLYILIWFWKQK